MEGGDKEGEKNVSHFINGTAEEDCESFNSHPPSMDLRDVQEVIDLPDHAPDEEELDDEDDGDMAIAMEETLAMTERDDASLVFTGHTKSVFKIGLIPSTESSTSLVRSRVAVSGGEDDRALVWSTLTGEVIYEISGHKDSVTQVGFSPAAFQHESKYLATADMAGFIQVFSVEDKSLVWSLDLECDLAWMSWHSSLPILLVGMGTPGDVWMFKMPSGESKHYPGYGCAVSTAALMVCGRTLLVGYTDGGIKAWGLRDAVALATFPATGRNHEASSLCGHSADVTCFAFVPPLSSSTFGQTSSNDNIFISASADGSIIRGNISNSKILNKIAPPKPVGIATLPAQAEDGASTHGCECAAISPTHPNLLAFGRLDGSVEIWDCPSWNRRHLVLPTPSSTDDGDSPTAVVCIVWSKQQPVMLVASSDGSVRCVDGRTGDVISLYLGHAGGILDMQLSQDESYFVTAADDATCRLFELG